MAVTLNIRVQLGTPRKMTFETNTLVQDACRMVLEHFPEARSCPGSPSEYGLFLADDDPAKGLWLENANTLEYYMLQNGDLLEYKKRTRLLRIRTIDDSVQKVMQIDDSRTLAELMPTICEKLNIRTHVEEYSVIRLLSEEETRKTMTLRKGVSIAKDQEKLDRLKKKLQTDDELNWLDPSKTLRQQNVQEDEVLILRRKFFYSDQNIDGRDPVQLNVLFHQLRDAVLSMKHPITLDAAVQLAGLDCQQQFGDFQEQRYRTGLDLNQLLPKEYVKEKKIERRIADEHRKAIGLTSADAKVKYIQLCRSLSTYGVTFFLVKEKVKGKNKLEPCLLGVTKDCVMRVSPKTKEVLEKWPLSMVMRWAPTPNSFTLDFGSYRDSKYSVQTLEGEQIAQLISGYIDIILKRRKGKDALGEEADETCAMTEDEVRPARAVIIEQGSGVTPTPLQTGSIALPGVYRSPAMPQAAGSGFMASQEEIPVLRSQALTAHAPPTRFAAAAAAAAGAGNPSAGSITVQNLGAAAQRGLLTTINENVAQLESVKAGLRDESAYAPLSGLGNDSSSKKWRETTLDVSRQNIGAQLSAMSAATAKMVTLSGAHQLDEADYVAVGSAISTIGTNITHMVDDLRMIAALQDEPEENERLLGAAKRLADAFSDLLKVAQPQNIQEVHDRQALLAAATKVGEISTELMKEVRDADAEEVRMLATRAESALNFQERLVTLTKAVANETAGLVRTVKAAAAVNNEPQSQQRMIGVAMQSALATSQLVACARVVAPTIATNTACQQQLVEAANQVQKSVEQVSATVRISLPEDYDTQQSIFDAADAVSRALSELLEHARSATVADNAEVHEKAIDTIATMTEKLNASSEPPEMLRDAKALAGATTDLINALRLEADQQADHDQQKRLLTAAKSLADATMRLMEAAKGFAANPDELENQQRLREIAEELRRLSALAGVDVLRKSSVLKLEHACRITADNSKQLLNMLDQACRKLPGENAAYAAHQTEFGSLSGRFGQEIMPLLVRSLKQVAREPDLPAAQASMLSAAADLMEFGSGLHGFTESVLPAANSNDQVVAYGVTQSLEQLLAALSELRAAISRTQDVCGFLFEIESARDRIAILQEDVHHIREEHSVGALRPLPGETLDWSIQQSAATIKQVGSALAQLLTAAGQSNEEFVGAAARDTANALRQLVNASRALAAAAQQNNNSPPATQTAKLLERVAALLDCSVELMAETAQTARDFTASSNPVQTRLVEVAREVSNAVFACLNCLPGQLEIDAAIERIQRSAATVAAAARKSVTEESAAASLDAAYYARCQTDLNSAALHLVNMVAEFSQRIAALTPANHAATLQELAQLAAHYAAVFESLVDACARLLCGLLPTEASAALRADIIALLRAAVAQSVQFLQLIKTVSGDVTQTTNVRATLTQNSRALTDTLNQLITLFTSGSPAISECDNAIRRLQACAHALQTASVNEPTLATQPYFDCLSKVTETAKTLAHSITAISQSAKSANVEEFVNSVRALANAICVLIDNALHAAYLIGVAEPGSEPGSSGLFDHSMFLGAQQEIHAACHAFSESLLDVPADDFNMTDSQREQRHQLQQSRRSRVLSAATTLAKQTSLICTACRSAANATTNAVAKRRFIQSAKDIANHTSTLVRAIKQLDSGYSEDNRRTCVDSAKPLLESVNELVMFASSPDFAARPARISNTGADAQRPVVAAGNSSVEAAIGMLVQAKSLVVQSTAVQYYQQYAVQSQKLSEAIKRLVAAMRDGAPGLRECDAAIIQLESLHGKVEDAELEFIEQVRSSSNASKRQSVMATVAYNTVQGFQQQMQMSARQLGELSEPLRRAALGEPQRVGRLVGTLTSYAEPLVQGALGLAQRLHSDTTLTGATRLQTLLLEQTKTLLEAGQSLVGAVKDCAANERIATLGEQAGAENPDDAEFVRQLDEAGQTFSEALTELQKTVSEMSARVGNVNALLDTLSRAVIGIDRSGNESQLEGAITAQSSSSTYAAAGASLQQASLTVGGAPAFLQATVRNSYVDYQTQLVSSLQRCSRLLDDVLMKAGNVLQRETSPNATSSPEVAMRPNGETLNELGTLAQQLTNEYVTLSEAARGALQTSTSTETGKKTRALTQELGQSLMEVVRNVGTLQHDPRSELMRVKCLPDSATTCREKITQLLAHLQAAARGTQACINAINSMSAIISDMDTVIMFASAGTLASEESQTDSFARYRESILQTAKSLVEDTKALVQGATADQEKLAGAAQQAVSTITQLTETVKSGAASLGSQQPEAQVLLVNAAKDVALALASFINATKNAFGRSVDDPAVTSLRDSAKTMAGNIYSLLKTVRTVEDESQRGLRALEAAIEYIAAQERAYENDPNFMTETRGTQPGGSQSSSVDPRTLTVLDLIRFTRAVTQCTAQVMRASSSGKQDELITLANSSRRAVRDMLVACRAIHEQIREPSETNEQLKRRLLEVGQHAASVYKALLECLVSVVQQPTVENKTELTNASRHVSVAITDLVAVAEQLKNEMGSQTLTLYYRRLKPVVRTQTDSPSSSVVSHDTVSGEELAAIGGGDMMSIAEIELTGAANAIEAAVRRLARAQPRKSMLLSNQNQNQPNTSNLENSSMEMTFENVDSQLVEAVRGVAAATSQLVRGAFAAQREAQQRQSAVRNSSSSTLGRQSTTAMDEEQAHHAANLVNSSKLVAAATHNLCETANALLQGFAKEEQLTSAARQVAAATAQLLVVCKVAGDQSSAGGLSGIQQAGQAVKRATDLLLKTVQSIRDASVEQSAAQQPAAGLFDERTLAEQSRSIVGGMRSLLAAQEEIIRKEKELESARHKLFQLRQEQYRANPEVFEQFVSSTEPLVTGTVTRRTVATFQVNASSSSSMQSFTTGPPVPTTSSAAYSPSILQQQSPIVQQTSTPPPPPSFQSQPAPRGPPPAVKPKVGAISGQRSSMSTFSNGSNK